MQEPLNTNTHDEWAQKAVPQTFHARMLYVSSLFEKQDRPKQQDSLLILQKELKSQRWPFVCMVVLWWLAWPSWRGVHELHFPKQQVQLPRICD